MQGKTLAWICLALVGFAGNSVLCRLALATRDIDAVTFTTLRLVSGGIALALLARVQPGSLLRAGSTGSALALFLYAAPFSYAYLELSTGTGALILFGAVQSTMLGWAIWKGERPSARAWIGVALALLGLASLCAPGLSAPDPLGALSMTMAGVAWGVYSLRGKSSRHPALLTTAANFVRALPFALALSALRLGSPHAHASTRGFALAVASGALASGLGYTLWYAALPHLAATQAAIVQLLVPVLAALAGIALLAEPPTLRLAVSGALIGAGVLLALPRPVRS